MKIIIYFINNNCENNKEDINGKSFLYQLIYHNWNNNALYHRNNIAHFFHYQGMNNNLNNNNNIYIHNKATKIQLYFSQLNLHLHSSIVVQTIKYKNNGGNKNERL